ncbi:hypothetical protein HFP05_01605 [Rhodanobacter denitrificans]|nr:hypothetical protein [Rhodanobacter denitrificans]
MPAGLQVWDAAGNLIFDTGDRLSRRVASIAITAGATGSVTVPGSDPIWYYVSNRNSVGNASTYTPKITLSSRTISWVPNTAYSVTGMVDVILVYGVY